MYSGFALVQLLGQLLVGWSNRHFKTTMTHKIWDKWLATILTRSVCVSAHKWAFTCVKCKKKTTFVARNGLMGLKNERSMFSLKWFSFLVTLQLAKLKQFRANRIRCNRPKRFVSQKNAAKKATALNSIILPINCCMSLIQDAHNRNTVCVVNVFMPMAAGKRKSFSPIIII